MPSRNASAVQLQRSERILNREFKIRLLSKNCESKPSTSTTSKILLYNYQCQIIINLLISGNVKLT